VVVTYLMVSPCGPLRLHSAPVRHANIILRFSPPTIIFRSHESSEAKNLLSTNFFAFSYLFHLSFILHLIFMVPCIMITFFKMTNKMQMCWIIYCSLTALHVSSDVFAHHQEHLNCITASVIIHVCRCRLVSWMIWNLSMTPAGSDIREFQLIHNTRCNCVG